MRRRYSRCQCRVGIVPGIVLDPFMGSGTTALVARELGRRFVGIELNPEYCRLAERRLKEPAGREKVTKGHRVTARRVARRRSNRRTRSGPPLRVIQGGRK